MVLPDSERAGVIGQLSAAAAAAAAYGGKMKALHCDVYIIVVHRNSSPPFFALPSTISSTFSHYAHLSFSAFSLPFVATLFKAFSHTQASTFLFYSTPISIALVSPALFVR